MTPPTPTIQLLFWDGCPSHPRALAELQAVVVGAGLDSATIELLEIATEQDAVAAGFVGSPTVRVDGVDVEPPQPDAVPSLSCRVYRRPSGRYSPLPDIDDVRRAVIAATQAPERNA
jgi:hypothetical protein